MTHSYINYFYDNPSTTGVRFICNWCGRRVNGVTYINGVPYCQYCEYVINKNNSFRCSNSNQKYINDNNIGNGGDSAGILFSTGGDL